MPKHLNVKAVGNVETLNFIHPYAAIVVNIQLFLFTRQGSLVLIMRQHEIILTHLIKILTKDNHSTERVGFSARVL